MSSLFEECIEALNPKVLVLKNDEGKIVADTFLKSVKQTSWGRIDWHVCPMIFQTCKFSELEAFFKKEKWANEELYIFWIDISHKVLKTDLISLLRNIDDITAVSFGTFILFSKQNLFVEIWSDEFTVGMY